MELPPATSAAATVFRGRPLTCPDDGQTRAVKHEMEALAGRDRSQMAPQMLTAPGERRLVGSGEIAVLDDYDDQWASSRDLVGDAV